MTKITHEGVKFDWGDKAEAACKLIKQKMCGAPILALHDLNMRQRHCLELLGVYDCEIRYYPGKVNAVADALSRKE
ncbi:hypothetical protein Tco_0571962 [Tanacetum coccineum]